MQGKTIWTNYFVGSNVLGGSVLHEFNKCCIDLLPDRQLQVTQNDKKVKSCDLAVERFQFTNISSTNMILHSHCFTFWFSVVFST